MNSYYLSSSHKHLLSTNQREYVNFDLAGSCVVSRRRTTAVCEKKLMDIRIPTEHHVGRLVYLDEDYLVGTYLRVVSE